MANYWMRKRSIQTLAICVFLALTICWGGVFPFVEQKAALYNSQSIYKNTSIDFIVPEPSFEQVQTLVGGHGIEDVFPFYQTSASIGVNGKSRTTNVLICDKKQNLGMTMYNEERLIEVSENEVMNPILVDWQFCHDTKADIGEKIVVPIGNTSIECNISAVYETNSIYGDGAVLIQVSDELMSAIQQQSMNSGYSGMYVSADDYDACRLYLTTDYRPMGRLKNRELFKDDEQYQIHYNAIMSSGYANEITDFRMRENDLVKEASSLRVWLGAALSVVLLFVFNWAMKNRHCEKAYFDKQCIPRGQNIKPYYWISFAVETALCIASYAVVLTIMVKTTDKFIHESAINHNVYIVPMFIFLVELGCIIWNMLSYSKPEVQAIGTGVSDDIQHNATDVLYQDTKEEK